MIYFARELSKHIVNLYKYRHYMTRAKGDVYFSITDFMRIFLYHCQNLVIP